MNNPVTVCKAGLLNLSLRVQLILLLCFCPPLLASPTELSHTDANPADVSRTDARSNEVSRSAVTVWSQGVRLAGDLYTPKSLLATQKLPGILMVPGWGGNKHNIGRNYAPHFAQQGYIVLALDFKGWGESDGPLLISESLPASEEASDINVTVKHIRKVIDPLSMTEDVRAALHYLGSEPQVLPDALGIWGTSMGGGLALMVAIGDNRVKALVDQMGPVNYPYNLRQLPAKDMRHMEAQMARGVLPAYPGPSPQSHPLLKGYPNWVAMKRFNPLKSVAELTAPTLIIDAEKETLFEIKKNGLLLHNTIKDRIESRYLVLPGGHYDMYNGANLETSRNEAIAWFAKHLKPDTTLPAQ